MAMGLLSYLADYGDTIYYDESFMRTLIAHRQIFLKEGNYTNHIVDQKVSIRCEGNLYAYLDSLGIAKCYHFIILFINGYSNPIEFKRNTISLKIPAISIIERIKEIHQVS